MAFIARSYLILISIVAVLAHARGQELKWASFHRGASTDTAASSWCFGDLKWKYRTGDKIFSSPAILEGVAYVGSGDNYLYAIDIASGALKWKFKTGGAVHSSPAVYQNSIFFGSFDGFYYAVDRTTGMEIWKVKTKGEKWVGGNGYFGMKPVDQYMEDPWDYFLSSPAIAFLGTNPTVYFGSSDGNLYAIDATNGHVKWKYRTMGIIHTTPWVDKKTVYVGSWDTNLYAIDAISGKLKWKFKTGDQPGMSGIQASVICHENRVYFGARDAFVYALDATTGKLIWKYDAEKSWILSTAAISTGGELYVGTSDSFLLLALDAKTGKEKYRFKTNGYVYSSPVVAGHTAFFGDFTGKLFALDLTSEGKKWDEFVTDARKENAARVLKEDKLDFAYAAGGKDLSLYSTTFDVMNKFYSLGPIVSTPAVSDNVVYVTSADGLIYAVNLQACD